MFLLLSLLLNIHIPSQVTANSGINPRWLVKTYSTYLDEGFKEETGISGTAVVFRWHEKILLLTASHTVGGKSNSIRIEYEEKDITSLIVRKFFNHSKDLALIELKEFPGTVELEFDTNYLMPAIVSKEQKENFLSLVALASNDPHLLRGSYDSFLPIAPWNKENKTTIPWEINPILIFSSYFPHELSRGLFTPNYIQSNLVSEFSIESGMSGTPIFTPYAKSKGSPLVWSIYGIASQSSVFFNRSYFIGAAEILSFLIDFKDGNFHWPHEKSTQWKLRNGLLYRDFGNNISEIIPSTEITTQEASGRGGRVGRGRGGRVGRAEIPTQYSEDPWDLYKIKPGIIWHGKEALVFALGNKFDQGQILSHVYANPSAIEFFTGSAGMKSKALGLEAIPLSEGDIRFGSLFERKLTISKEKSINVTDKLLQTCTVKKYKDSSYLVTIKMRKYDFNSPENARKIVEQVRVERSSQKPYSIEQFIDFMNQYPANDEIVLILNEKGVITNKLSGGNKFMPIVQARGTKSGILYTIDIIGLFFTDFDLLPSPSFLNKFRIPVRQELLAFHTKNGLMSDLFQFYSEHAYISIRSSEKTLEDTVGCFWSDAL